MLNSLRAAAGTWVAKLLLILLVVSFAVWGISGSIMGQLGSHVVSVGDTRVSVLEYRLAYDRQLAQLSQQFGTNITREQARSFGVDQQVLAQLVAGALLDEQAREMNLGLSRDRLARLTAEDPAFQGAGGNFDRNQFEFVLDRVGMSAEDYLRDREQVAIRQQIVEAVSHGMEVPDAFLRAVSLYRGENRTVDFLVLPSALVEPIDPPTDEQLAAYFEENKAEYAAPEYRKVSYVKLEPADIADPAAISDEQAREYYEANVERYTEPEQRTIEQLVFADEEAAKAALEQIRGGATFEEIVEAQGRKIEDVLLGTFEKERIADQAIAEAAFALEERDVSEVVPGSFGPILLRVTEIVPAKTKPFEEVAEEIRNELALDEANNVLLDVYAAYEDARASGQTMAEAAASQKLEVVTIEAVDSAGRDPEDTVLTDIPQSEELLREVFETEAGIENPPLNIGSAGFLFYEVDEVTPARDRELDEVRERVEADWIAQETQSRLAARAADIEKQLKDGTPFAEIATGLGLEVQTKRGLERSTTDDADLGQAGVAAVFGVTPQGSGVVASPSGDAQIVFKVTEAMVPADAGPEAVPEDARTQFASGMQNDLLDQLVARLQAKYSVEINRGAIDQALSF